MSLSAARRFADAPFGLMLASDDKLRAAFAVIARLGTGNKGPDAARMDRLRAALSAR